MSTSSLLKTLIAGPGLARRMREGDVEYNRKASLLIVFAFVAAGMKCFFSAISFATGDYVHGIVNAVVFILVAAGYMHMRLSGNCAVAVYLFLSLLGTTFLSDFASGIHWAMWSYLMPLLCFFLLGVKRGAAVSAAFLLLECCLMVFIFPQNYSFDFKTRFPAIYVCIALGSLSFELVRSITQGKLDRSRAMMKVQRDIGIVMSTGERSSGAFNLMLSILAGASGEIDGGGIYLVDKKTKQIDLAEHRGLSNPFIETASHFAPGSPQAKLILEGKPVYRKAEAPGSSAGEAGGREAVKSSAVLPIWHEANVIAALIMVSHRAGELSAETRTLLESIASNLGNAIGRMIAIEELRLLSARNDAILAAVPDIIVEADAGRVFTWANKAGYDFFGGDVVGKQSGAFVEEEHDSNRKPSFAPDGRDELAYVENWMRRRDGEKRLLAWWSRTLKDCRGAVTGVLSTARDITEIHRMERHLLQSQKMDAVGQLAGGIAHDFNNQLAAITGFADLLRKHTGENQKLSYYADSILLSAKRAADLTSQLLAFSRKGKVMSVVADLHKIILEVMEILSHTLDKKIVITRRLTAAPASIQCDPTQIQNALLNLALNARDAMPGGGELLFQTDRLTLDGEFCRSKRYDIPEGTYIQVTVSDSGTGMDAEVQKHVFEPFYTTKEKGRGTGMGLAAVYGTVKSHKGMITFYSERGHGTTFKLYFPAAEKETAAETAPGIVPAVSNKALTVLFVDDEGTIRDLAGEMLRSFGHHVVAVENGKKAVDYYRNTWKSVDLVILDMIMPVMAGKETFIAMRSINPGVKAILSSGYSLTGEAQQILDEGVLGFVQKPFRSAQLFKAIEEAMIAGSYASAHSK